MVSNHYLERTAMRKYMLLIEKTLSFEKYKTRTMRPNGFLGRGLLALQIHIIFFLYELALSRISLTDSFKQGSKGLKLSWR